MVDKPIIAITGARGHVGGRLLKYFCTDTRTHIRPNFRTTLDMPEWITRCTPIFGDLRDTATRRELLGNSDVVVHLATRGYSSARQPSSSQLDEEYSVTTELIRDSVTLGISTFIFISSIHVLGKALAGQVTESTTPLVSNEYGRSKLRLELELHNQCTGTKMTPIVLRMANAFGVPAFPQAATWNLLIHDLCRQAVTSDLLVLNSNGTGYRNILTLRDATSAIAQVATLRIPAGTYLLTGPRTYQIYEIAELVRSRAETVLDKSLTVVRNENDSSSHESFTLCPTTLDAFGIPVGNHLIEEVDELLHAANLEFSGSKL